MNEQSLNQLTERQVFAKTLWNAISNTFWFSVAAFVIVLITKLSMTLAIVLAVLYLIVIGIDVVWVLVTVIVPGFIAIPLAIRAGSKAIQKEAWMFLATIARLLDVSAGILLGCYLYWRIF